MALQNTNFSNQEINNFLKNAKRIFFIGIGGISMSSIATYLHYNGMEIYGYDRERTEICQKLEAIAEIKYYSTPDRVRGMDLVVYSLAVEENNFEYKMAKKLQIPTLSRANLLGYIISSYKTSIGIAGTHGKSTTVSLLSKIFDYAGQKPTVFCGAYMKDFGGAFLMGNPQVCIYEACEYKNSFLSMIPEQLGILNIEYDHPDFFETTEKLEESFIKLSNTPNKVFLNADDKVSKKIINREVISYGIESDADYRAIIESDGFSVIYKGEKIAKCKAPFKGKHFVYDAICAFAIAHQNNVLPNVICSAISEFRGLKRRLEYIGKTDTSLPIFEDYAHHPTEIKATLSALLEMGYKRIFVVFQPHTYSRSYYLYDKFTEAFNGASEIYFLPTYKAREENVFGLDEEKFALDSGGELLHSYESLKERISKTNCDVILISGAGDITNFKKYL